MVFSDLFCLPSLAVAILMTCNNRRFFFFLSLFFLFLPFVIGRLLFVGFFSSFCRDSRPRLLAIKSKLVSLSIYSWSSAISFLPFPSSSSSFLFPCSCHSLFFALSGAFFPLVCSSVALIWPPPLSDGLSSHVPRFPFLQLRTLS